jgi:hypothetical protein
MQDKLNTPRINLQCTGLVNAVCRTNLKHALALTKLRC